jgi:hypothetical protein
MSNALTEDNEETANASYHKKVCGVAEAGRHGLRIHLHRFSLSEDLTRE